MRTTELRINAADKRTFRAGVTSSVVAKAPTLVPVATGRMDRARDLGGRRREAVG